VKMSQNISRLAVIITNSIEISVSATTVLVVSQLRYVIVKMSDLLTVKIVFLLFSQQLCSIINFCCHGIVRL
jgi:hypothetical protein